MKNKTNDASEMLTALGRSIRKYRKAKGLVQKELGHLSRKGVHTIQRVERGEDVHISTLLAIVGALDRRMLITIEPFEWEDYGEVYSRAVDVAAASGIIGANDGKES